MAQNRVAIIVNRGPSYYPVESTTINLEIPAWVEEAQQRALFRWIQDEVDDLRTSIESFITATYPEPELITADA